MTAGTDVRRLILLRHGQTEWNADDRMQGQIDTHLTPLGRAQAVEAARVIAMMNPSIIVSSDLLRAFDTATQIGHLTGLEVLTDKRLRETQLGDWQGLSHSEVDAQFPGARLAWRADPTMAPPGGESRVEVAHRSVPVIEELLATHPEWASGPVVCVAHGGLIAALTAALLNLPVPNWAVFGGLGNASWVQLSRRGHHWRLDVWNASARVASDVL
ncbi:histidine phosphatase family protein [Smaragdicoccus niigatensis]|nr:histidine phosphatase family protein [Smaragdicoccus niigatensis]